MIASVKLAQVQKHLSHIRVYQQKISTIVGAMLHCHSDSSENTGLAGSLRQHPLVVPYQTEKTGYLVLTTDKGLCGSFNTNIVQQYSSYAKKESADRLSLYVVGKKGIDALRHAGIQAKKEYVNMYAPLSYKRSMQLTEDLINWYHGERLNRLYVLYTQSKSILKQYHQRVQLLPLDGSLFVKPEIPYWDSGFEPDSSELMHTLVVSYVQIRVFNLLQESYLSELSARLTTMDNASKNAQELIETTTLSMNKIRQATITRELTEIVAAGEALR